MKPLTVHNIAGEPRRLSPLQVVGWVDAEHQLDGGKILVGSIVAMAHGAAVPVRESAVQMDWLFEQATGFRLDPEDLAALRALMIEDATPGHG